MPQEMLYATINSGSQVSGDIDLAFGNRIWAIQVPAITSGDLLIQGGIDGTDFRRLLETRVPGSGDLRFATGPGSRMIPWPSDVPMPQKLRLETAVAQQLSNVATFGILVR